jgi:hypothetical protein
VSVNRPPSLFTIETRKHPRVSFLRYASVLLLEAGQFVRRWPRVGCSFEIARTRGCNYSASAPRARVVAPAMISGFRQQARFSGCVSLRLLPFWVGGVRMILVPKNRSHSDRRPVACNTRCKTSTARVRMRLTPMHAVPEWPCGGDGRCASPKHSLSPSPTRAPLTAAND